MDQLTGDAKSTHAVTERRPVDRVRRVLERMPLACGLIAVGVGLFVLLGSFLGRPSWTSIFPGLPAMVGNTAVMAAFSGVSLILVAARDAPRRRSVLGKVLASAVAIIAALTLAEYLFGIDARIDQVLPSPERIRFRPISGRPSPQTATAFALVALSLILTDRKTARGRRPSEFIAMFAGIIPLVALLGYVFGSAALYGPLALYPYTGMGVGTTVSLLALSAGILSSRSGDGALSVLRSSDSGGFAARQLTAWLLVLAIATVAFEVAARFGLYEPPIGSALAVLFGSVGGAAFVLRLAQRLSRVDQERTAAERALRQSRDQLRLAEARSTGILTTSADAIISTDDSQFITAFNEGAAKIFGYTRDEVIGAPVETLMPTRFRRAHRRHVEHFIAGSESSRRMGEREMEIVALRKSGEEFPVDAAISKLEVDGVRVLTVALRDITEQRRHERNTALLAQMGAAASSSLDYEATLPIMARLVVLSFADLCVVDLVEGGEARRLAVTSRDPSLVSICDALMGSRPAGETPTRRLPATESSDGVQQMQAEMLVPSAPIEMQRQLHDALGLVSVIVLPLTTHGRTLGAISFVRGSTSHPYDRADVAVAKDLAERATLCVENGQLYRSAQIAVEDRDQLVGIVAHDLRNPLSAILLAANHLRDLGPSPDVHAEETVAVILRSGNRMNRLIGDLLDETAIEAGRLSIELDRVDSAELLGEAVRAEAPLASSKSLTLRLDAPSRLPAIQGDRQRLLQVFENLIGNAIKFTESGGSVTVGADRRNGDVLFRVSDTGIGIEAGDVPHVFDRFWRARGHDHDGAGLGLPIVQGIVTAHGGRIWVEATPHQGSTFFFTIPVAEARN
jgi:PAS domain S-box-containing protein